MSYKAVFILAIIVATGCTENVFYRYLGCYKNSDSDPAMGTPITDDLMTNEFCADYCYGIGQIFAANEEGDRCFCGINYMKHGPRSDDECDTGCPGNSSQTCGGVHRMSVYEKVVPSAYPNAAMVGGPRGVETKFQIANSWITSDVSPETTKYARILEAGSSGWSPGSGQTGNWLQINMHSVYLAAGVVTQGDATKNKWVTSFMVIYSVDGVVWNSAISMNETTIFNGHNQLNKDTPIINQFYNMVKAKYIRFVTVTCEWACNLRVEVLVNEPLGMETKDISDDNIMVDSVYNDDVIMYGALHARLKNTLGSGCWMPKHNGDKLTIDLLAMTLIRAIAVQGCSDIADSSPDAFIIMYGETGIPDTEYTGNNGNTQNFTVTANNNEEVSVIHFDVALFARSIAILPFKINGNVGIRLELYGYRTDKTSCVEWLRAGYKGGLTYWVDVDRFGTEPARRKICHGEVYPLGMMSGNIRSGQLSESSSTSEKYTADAARLNYADSSYDPPPAWMPQTESSSFIGINLIYRTILRMIATQGQGTAWVKSFYFSYGVDQSPLNEYKEHGFRKEFQANTDEFTIVRNELLYPLRMIRYIKIYPLCWENTVALRMELYGQYLDHPYLNEDYLEFVEGSYIHTLHKLSSPVPKRKIIDGNPYPGNCTDTKTPEVKSYIRVDMPEVKNFMSVSIVNNDDFPEESVKLQATVGVEKQWAENTNCGDMIESLDAGEIGYFMCSDNGNEYINGSTVATAINDPREKHRLCLCEMYAFEYFDSEAHALEEDCMDSLGVEHMSLDDKIMFIVASSAKDGFLPHQGALNFPGATWSPSDDDVEPFLEVFWNGLNTIKRIAVQGYTVVDGDNVMTDWRILTFKLQYSVARIDYVNYNDNDGQPVTFTGNVDKFVTQYINLDPNILASAVRFVPLTWTLAPALRVEIYGCPVVKESCQVWFESGYTQPAWYWSYTDNKLDIDSYYCIFERGKSNSKISSFVEATQSDDLSDTTTALNAVDGQITTCAITKKEESPWLTLEFEPHEIQDMIIYPQYNDDCLQACDLATACRFKYTYSKIYLGQSETPVDDDICMSQITESMLDSPEALYVHCDQPRLATYMHLVIWDISSQISICEIDLLPLENKAWSCNDDLGMQNGDIEDSQLDASTNTDDIQKVRYGQGGWCGDIDSPSWIQVDFKAPTFVSQVLIFKGTEGRITSFFVSHSMDGVNFTRVLDDRGQDMVFPGNVFHSTLISGYLPLHIYTRFLRLESNEYEDRPCMQIKLYGCRKSAHSCKDWREDPNWYVGDNVYYRIDGSGETEYKLCCTSTMSLGVYDQNVTTLSSSSYNDEAHSPDMARNRGYCKELNGTNESLVQFLPNPLVTSVAYVSVKGDNNAFMTYSRYTDYAEWYMLRYQAGERIKHKKQFYNEKDEMREIYEQTEKSDFLKKDQFSTFWINYRVTDDIFYIETGRCGEPAILQYEDSNPLLNPSDPVYFGYRNFGSGVMDFILCLDQPGNECWKPNMNSTSDPDPWLKIELPAVTFVTHVETFGGIVDRVIKYKLGYSTDDEVYEYYKEMGQEKEIYANAYPMHIHKYELLSPIMARFVKIYPTEWENSICLAVELYGCLDGLIKPTCDDWLAGGFNNNWYWIGTMDNYTKDFCGVVQDIRNKCTNIYTEKTPTMDEDVFEIPLLLSAF